MWMPASFPPWMRTNLSWHDSQIVARLKPGVTVEHAQQSMAALSLQVTAKNFRGPRSVLVAPLRAEIAGRTRTALILLLSASGALLLIACVNLTNLLLSRGAARGREVAVRAALGAARGRLVSQFLIESLVLAALGTLAGLAIALPAMRFLERLVPEAMGAARLTLDWRVLAFSAAAAIGSALTFGLAPALRGSQVAPQEALRDGGRGIAGARRHWFQHSLIVVETALAVVLLTCCGLLLQTFQHLRNTDVGFRSERLLTFETPLVPLQGLPAARRLHQRRGGGRARHSGRGQRRCDQSHSVHERRRRDLLLAGGAAQIQHPAAGRAHSQRQPRLSRDCRRDSARRQILQRDGPSIQATLGHRQRAVCRPPFPRPISSRPEVQVWKYR